MQGCLLLPRTADLARTLARLITQHRPNPLCLGWRETMTTRRDLEKDLIIEIRGTPELFATKAALRAPHSAITRFHCGVEISLDLSLCHRIDRQSNPRGTPLLRFR